MQKNSKLGMAGLLTIGVLLLVCAFSMSFNLLGVTLNPLIDEFQLVGASQGLMASMMSFGSMIPLLIIPFLQGRVNKLGLILFGAALQLLMLVFTGMSGSFGALLAFCALLGAGNNITDSCCNSFMVDLHPVNNNRYLGLLHGFYGIGGLLTPLFATWILSLSNWRATYFAVAAVFALLCILLVYGALRCRKQETPVAGVEKPLSRAMLAEYLRGKRNLLLLGAGALYAAGQLGLLNWMVRYTTVRFDNAEIGSVCLSVYWICVTICRLLSPQLPFRPARMLVVGALGGGATHVLGVVSGSAVGMLIACGVIGLLSGLCVPVLVSEASRGNEDKTSLVSSAIFLLMGLARMLIPLLMGAVAASSISIAMILPAIAMLLCGLLCQLADMQKG